MAHLFMQLLARFICGLVCFICLIHLFCDGSYLVLHLRTKTNKSKNDPQLGLQGTQRRGTFFRSVFAASKLLPIFVFASARASCSAFCFLAPSAIACFDEPWAPLFSSSRAFLAASNAFSLSAPSAFASATDCCISFSTFWRSSTSDVSCKQCKLEHELVVTATATA